jgi:hypothetical protein
VLFSPAPPGPLLGAPYAYKRFRFVYGDVALLERACAAGGSITVNLFDDAVYRAQLDHPEPLPPAAVTCRGVVEGDPFSYLRLTYEPARRALLGVVHVVPDDSAGPT